MRPAWPGIPKRLHGRALRRERATSEALPHVRVRPVADPPPAWGRRLGGLPKPKSQTLW
jgi:hypothetical protein